MDGRYDQYMGKGLPCGGLVGVSADEGFEPAEPEDIDCCLWLRMCCNERLTKVK